MTKDKMIIGIIQISPFISRTLMKNNNHKKKTQDYLQSSLMCIYVYIHVYIHIFMHTYIYIYIHTLI